MKLEYDELVIINRCLLEAAISYRRQDLMNLANEAWELSLKLDCVVHGTECCTL